MLFIQFHEPTSSTLKNKNDVYVCMIYTLFNHDFSRVAYKANPACFSYLWYLYSSFIYIGKIVMLSGNDYDAHFWWRNLNINKTCDRYIIISVWVFKVNIATSWKCEYISQVLITMLRKIYKHICMQFWRKIKSFIVFNHP